MAHPDRPTLHAIRWHIPRAQGDAFIHIHQLMQGEPMIWPTLQQSPLGRQFQKLRDFVKANRESLKI